MKARARGGAGGARRAPETELLLSIRPEHAERIFQRTKRYELRKVLPSFDFTRVFLCETGGQGVVGCFDVGSVICKTIDRLWRLVGNAATTRRRFYDYFASATRGYAIEVRNPVRFLDPVSSVSVNGELATVIPPQGYVALEAGDPLHTVLESERLRALRGNPPKVSLRRISRGGRSVYRKLVTRHISPHYEEIDETFAASALKIHDLGKDPAGFFTTEKRVLEILDERRRVVGFTTLTYKSGGCVKTGPTVLLRPFRRRGYGLATRLAVEEYVRSADARKIYCTCPEGAETVVRYLLRSGMRIEAHLERHYAATHNELVFGKLLVADEPPAYRPRPATRERPGTVCDPGSFRRRTLAADFAKLFERTWSHVSLPFARGIVAQALDPKPRRPSSKPKRLVCLGSGGRCIAAIVLLPKRGGSVKGLFLRRTGHESSLRSLLGAACGMAARMGARKLYFLHPMFDSPVLGIIRSAGFQVEGLIRAPYRSGQDVVVISRFL